MSAPAVRDEAKVLKKNYDKTEDDLKALQSVGQIIGEVLRRLDDERFIVKASSGPRYVVGSRSTIDKEALIQGTRVTLDMTTLTIMRALPREVDPGVFLLSLILYVTLPFFLDLTGIALEEVLFLSLAPILRIHVPPPFFPYLTPAYLTPAYLTRAYLTRACFTLCFVFVQSSFI